MSASDVVAVTGVILLDYNYDSSLLYFLTTIPIVLLAIFLIDKLK